MFVGTTTSGAVKVTEQLPDERVHCEEEKVPPLGEEKLTAPWGVMGVPDPTSWTVTVQVAVPNGERVLGVQAAVTETGLGDTLTSVLRTPPPWEPSPE